jgi:protein involved in polysaccharide export with SLBB domain/capsular polysaccharide biosynthesis protein
MKSSQAPSLPPASFDAWTAVDILAHRWFALLLWTLVFAAAGAGVAFLMWGRTFTSSAQLVHYEPSTIDDTYHPRALVTPSLVVMLQSPAVLEKMGADLQPPLSAKELAQRVQITLDRNNDVATITATAPTREASIDLVNRYTAAAVAYTQELQRQEAVEAGDNVTRQLAEVETELGSARAAIPSDQVAAVNSLSATPDTATASRELAQRVQAARDQLDDLLVRYTDAHPLVREQRARLAALQEAQSRAAAANPPGSAQSALPPAVAQALYGRISPEEVAMGERLRSLESNRAILLARQRAIQPFRDDPPGYFRVLSPVTANPTLEYDHRLELVLCACLGAIVGCCLGAGVLVLRELLDNRIKTRADARRVTGLPLLATLGNLRRLPPEQRDQAAFRAWTALQSRLSTSPHHGMVCGFTSAHAGDGRSAWVDLLARAACQSGYRVLTISTHATAKKLPVRAVTTGPGVSGDAVTEQIALTEEELSSPDRLLERLSSTDCPQRIDLPLSGWVWDVEHRGQWRSALELWSSVEHVVIFVELPPASATETVLLAKNIPNLVWVVDGHSSDAAETRAELANLRAADCHLVGAVLNREDTVPVQERYSRWFATATAAFAAALVFAGHPPRAVAAESAPAAVAVPATFSVVDPSQRADWQKRLTLGPGDLLRFQLYGAPDLTREDVPVDPDGRVSYLEAENVVATGLTVDELRDRVTTTLAKYRRTPQVSIAPLSFHSKHYYLLGSVMQRGVYPLDRPITIIEAVARAHGFETSISRGNVIETTDFSHSFIERGGRRLPVDFEKLFVHGDLSQNVVLEPDDYLYFPAGAAGAVYVLGEVRTPGAVAFDDQTSVLTAIANRGGFTERAWKQRVLVVRNSQAQPEAFRVNAYGALEGKNTNLELQPGDVVYVSNRPWIRVEELLDRAASAFVESAVITWTSIHVGAGIPDTITTATTTATP